MEEHTGIFRVTSMSRVLQVSRSGFYVWCKRQTQPSFRQQRQKQMDVAVAVESLLLALLNPTSRSSVLLDFGKKVVYSPYTNHYL
jgi:hypothetical protein